MSTKILEHISWAGNGSGKLSVGNCYHQIVKDGEPLSPPTVEMVVEKRVTLRNHLFLMARDIGKFLVSKTCGFLRKGIYQDDLCRSCSNQEDEIHIFKESYKAKHVWNITDPKNLGRLGDIRFHLLA